MAGDLTPEISSLRIANVLGLARRHCSKVLQVGVIISAHYIIARSTSTPQKQGVIDSSLSLSVQGAAR